MSFHRFPLARSGSDVSGTTLPRSLPSVILNSFCQLARGISSRRGDSEGSGKDHARGGSAEIDRQITRLKITARGRLIGSLSPLSARQRVRRDKFEPLNHNSAAISNLPRLLYYRTRFFARGLPELGLDLKEEASCPRILLVPVRFPSV